MQYQGFVNRIITCRAVVLAVVLVFGASCRRAAEQDPPPDYNVVLISVDTLRADRLNCYGYKERKVSPNIDALAAQGILFENHITACPWTTPAHLSMLTSLYPSAHGVTQSFDELKENLLQGARFNKLPEYRTTLAEVLKENGYATAAFTAGVTLDPKIGFGQGFELYDTSMYKLNTFNMGAMHKWIRQHSRGRFFLFWHNFEVHAPYLQGDFLGEVLPAETAARLAENLKRAAGPLKWHAPTVSERQTSIMQAEESLRQQQAYNAKVCEALYVGGVRSMDRWFGKFIQVLRARGLYDKSLIILTSDHGEEFGEHLVERIYGAHGHTLYEEMLRVPLIIKLPHQQYAGTRVGSAVRIIDIMPTILDLLRIRPRSVDMQGTSLRPLWEQGDRQEDRLAFSEALVSLREKKGIRTGRFKFIYSLDHYTVCEHGRNYIPEQLRDTELYDLHSDPAEKVNLLESPHPPEVAELAATLERQLREFVAGQHGQAESFELDPQTVENLKALGYVQ